jgi:hypothetical protein
MTTAKTKWQTSITYECSDWRAGSSSTLTLKKKSISQPSAPAFPKEVPTLPPFVLLVGATRT